MKKQIILLLVDLVPIWSSQHIGLSTEDNYNYDFSLGLAYMF